MAALHGVPLAIEQAAAYLSIYPSPSPSIFSKYLTRLKSEYEDVMKYIPKRSEWYYEKHRSVIDSFNILKKTLATTSDDAAKVLTFSAFLAPGDIPISILQAAEDADNNDETEIIWPKIINKDILLESELYSWLQNFLQNKRSCIQALIILQDHCCAKIRWNASRGEIISYSIHDAIRKWSQENLQDSAKDTWAVVAAFRLSQCLVSREVTIVSRQKYRRHVDLAERVLLRDESPSCMKAPDGPLNNHARIALASFARFHQRQKDLEKAQALVEKAIEFDKIIEGPKWPSVQCFQNLHLLGRVLWRCGDFAKALETSGTLVEACEAAFGVDDDFSLEISTQARLLKIQASRAASDWTRAVQYQSPEKPTNDIMTTYSTPSTISPSENETGIESMDQEEYALVQAITDLIPKHGDNSEIVGASRFALAIYCREASKWRRAASLFKAVWRSRYRPYMYSATKTLQSHYILEPFYNYLQSSQKLGLAIKPLVREFPAAMFWSQKACYYELTDLLTAHGVESPESTWHPLNYALKIYSGDEDKSKLLRLLKDPENNIEQRSPEGFTALHQAVMGKPLWIQDTLLRRGAHIEATLDDDYTALHLSVAHGNLSSVASLLSWGANVHAQTGNGFTPLHLAVITGDFGIVSLLLEAGANANASTTKSRLTPLHISTLRIPLCKALCLFDGDTLHSIPRYSAKWLELDVMENLTVIGNTIIQHIIEVGNAILLHTPSVPLFSPLVGSHYHQILFELLYNGGELEAKTIHGHTPLHLATTMVDWKAFAGIWNFDLGTRATICKNMQGVIRQLRSMGASSSTRDNDGNHLAYPEWLITSLPVFTPTPQTTVTPNPQLTRFPQPRATRPPDYVRYMNLSHIDKHFWAKLVARAPRSTLVSEQASDYFSSAHRSVDDKFIEPPYPERSWVSPSAPQATIDNWDEEDGDEDDLYGADE